MPPPTPSSFFVALLLVLLAALFHATPAGSARPWDVGARATGQMSRGHARVPGLFLADERRAPGSRELLQDAGASEQGSQPDPGPDQAQEETDSTPENDAEAAENAGDAGDADEGVASGLGDVLPEEPPTAAAEDTPPLASEQGNDNEDDDDDDDPPPTATAGEESR